jgi:hypothetical protein
MRRSSRRSSYAHTSEMRISCEATAPRNQARVSSCLLGWQTSPRTPVSRSNLTPDDAPRSLGVKARSRRTTETRSVRSDRRPNRAHRTRPRPPNARVGRSRAEPHGLALGPPGRTRRGNATGTALDEYSSRRTLGLTRDCRRFVRGGDRTGATELLDQQRLARGTQGCAVRARHRDRFTTTRPSPGAAAGHAIGPRAQWRSEIDATRGAGSLASPRPSSRHFEKRNESTNALHCAVKTPPSDVHETAKITPPWSTTMFGPVKVEGVRPSQATATLIASSQPNFIGVVVIVHGVPFLPPATGEARARALVRARSARRRRRRVAGRRPQARRLVDRRRDGRDDERSNVGVPTPEPERDSMDRRAHRSASGHGDRRMPRADGVRALAVGALDDRVDSGPEAAADGRPARALIGITAVSLRLPARCVNRSPSRSHRTSAATASPLVESSARRASDMRTSTRSKTAPRRSRRRTSRGRSTATSVPERPGLDIGPCGRSHASVST